MRVDSTVESVVERVAAIDIGKEEVVVCVRVPGPVEGQRSSEIRTFPTMTADLLELSQWLTDWGVRRVVMEATGDYWKPVFYVLEGSFEETWLVNAHDVKHVPGRPKTDRLDAQWLARLAEKGMLRPSFVPPPPLRELRDLTRYRVDLVVSRTAEKQRVEKLLEDAGVKLSVVATDIFGVSGRRMLKALAAGERDPQKLANLAMSVLRRKLDRLERSFVGRFNAHHGFLLGRMLRRVEDLDADIAAIEAQIEAHVQPFQDAIAETVDLELADTLDQMSIAVQAGLGFDAAMLRVARNGTGILSRELVRTMQDIQVGQSRRNAYEDLAERTGSIPLRRFVRTVIQAETYGIPLADVLNAQADEMRVMRRQRAERKAMEIPVKVVFPLILCILPVLFIVILGPAVITIMENLLPALG